MGRKKAQQRKTAAAASAAAGSEPVPEEDDAGFAARLLSTMNIEEQNNVQHDAQDYRVSHTNVAEEAVEETTDESAIKHPHLHQLHKSFRSVFHRDSSRSSHNSSRELSRSSSRGSQGSQHRSSSGSSGSAAVSDQPLPGVHHSGEPHNAGGSHLTPSDAQNRTRSSSTSTPSNSTTESEAGRAPGGKKRNRRREKLEERERERARIVQEAEAEAKTQPDKRLIELKGMGMMIAGAGLVEYEMQPDGHCLFHSLSDQLGVRRNVHTNAQQLRHDLAQYIREYPDDFVPYLIEDETGDVQDVAKYTSDLENTAMWGGELEIMAASRLHRVPVRVHFASHPALTVNEEEFPETEPLHLAYYQAKFGLGAHYNSLRDDPKRQDSY